MPESDPTDDPQEFTQTPVFAIHEHRKHTYDAPVMVFERDGETLIGVINYVGRLVASGSQIYDGTFHAVYPGADALEDGDLYLTQADPDVSHGLAEAVREAEVAADAE